MALSVVKVGDVSPWVLVFIIVVPERVVRPTVTVLRSVVGSTVENMVLCDVVLKSGSVDSIYVVGWTDVFEVVVV